jgi:hypothetical protein
MPRARYQQAQRWGSALPAPAGAGGRDEHGYSASTTSDVLGVRYESGMPPLLPAGAADAQLVKLQSGQMPDSRDFVAVDARRIYYAGDFCSTRAPGFEAAALSGRDVAQHMLSVLCRP